MRNFLPINSKFSVLYYGVLNTQEYYAINQHVEPKHYAAPTRLNSEFVDSFNLTTHPEKCAFVIRALFQHLTICIGPPRGCCAVKAGKARFLPILLKNVTIC
jgi:hypothetical protein